jgi:hypothetical protein
MGLPLLNWYNHRGQVSGMSHRDNAQAGFWPSVYDYMDYICG